MAKKKAIPINLNLNVRGLRKSATLAINEQCRQLASEGKEVYHLGLGQSPFPVPKPVTDALSVMIQAGHVTLFSTTPPILLVLLTLSTL